MEEKHIQQKELAEFLQIKNVSDWKSGKSKSYTKYLPQIAEFFGVSVDYLLGKEAAFEITDKEKLVIKAYRSHPLLQEAIDRMLEIGDE